MNNKKLLTDYLINQIYWAMQIIIIFNPNSECDQILVYICKVT